MTAVLELDGMRVVCAGEAGEVLALDQVDVTVQPGERVGLIGESGSGKTTLVRSVIGLLGRNCRPVAGRIRFRGELVFGDGVDTLRRIRGRHVGMIFQHATASLNPLVKVGAQIREVLRTHADVTNDEAGGRARALLARLGFDDPERVEDSYPHQLSGGMCQRAAIAVAVATEPDLVIADECTSALDVTTQAEVIELLRTVTRERSWTLLFVTHDILLATELCTRVVVLYGGQVVEDGPVAEVVSSPRHPYTRALLDAVPLWRPRAPLRGIAGTPPRTRPGFHGCRFAPRCAFATEECTADDVDWVQVSAQRGHRCLHPLPATADRDAS